MLSAEECLQWSVSTLKKHLQSQGVVTTGSKENLVERMLMLSEPSSPLKFKEKVKTSKAKPATKSGKLTKDVKAKGAKVEKVKKAKPVKTVKAVKAVKAMKAVKTARAKAADDVGDLHSSVASLNGCLRKVPNVKVGKALKPSTLSMQHRLAVRLYTAEEPLPLYKALNEPFHATSRSPNSITNQAPFLKIMAQAVRALAKGKALYTGPAYRGVKVAKSPLLKRKYENYSEAFKVGSRVTFAAFTSLSLADSTAESFGDRILFQFTRVRGVRIAELSAIPSEQIGRAHV